MEQFDKYFQDYKKSLNTNKSHFSYEVLSSYVISNQQFSLKEKSLIIGHVGRCNDCSAKYNQIFDYEFIPKKTVDLQTKVVVNKDSNRVIFYDLSKTTEFELFLEQNQLKGLFHNLSGDCIGRNIRFTTSVSSLIGRIVDAQVDEVICFEGEFKFDCNQIESIKLEISESQMGAIESSVFQTHSIPWLRYAAVAIIFIFIGSAVVFFNDRMPEPLTESGIPQETKSDTLKLVDTKKEKEDSSIIETKQSKRPVIEPKLIAENFLENSMLENFIDQNYRSETSVTGLYPVNGDTLRKPYLIKWVSKSAGSVLRISLLDNRNREVWQSSVSEEAVSVEIPTPLSPGLYYWKLLVNDNLFIVRKFYVRQ